MSFGSLECFSERVEVSGELWQWTVDKTKTILVFQNPSVLESQLLTHNNIKELAETKSASQTTNEKEEDKYLKPASQWNQFLLNRPRAATIKCPGSLLSALALHNLFSYSDDSLYSESSSKSFSTTDLVSNTGH